MVRVLGATGRIFEAAAVVPTVEARIEFNGNTQRLFEAARSMNENPNGLLFIRDTEYMDSDYIGTGNALEYIGNISTSKVKEALTWLLTEGFYNFSEWDYQQERDLDKIVLDNGKSHPYSSAITKGLFSGLLRNPASTLDLSNSWSFLGSKSEDSCKTMMGDVDDLQSECITVEDDYLDDYDDAEEDGWGEWYDSEE